MNASQEKRTVPRSDSLTGSQLGMTLIEVLIAISILAAVATVFLSSMSTSTKAVMVNQEQVSGESLAKSQMEAIKLWAYDKTNLPNYDAAKLADIPADYDIDIGAECMDPARDGTDTDDGLQEITVTVTHKGDPIFTLEGYKCLIGQ